MPITQVYLHTRDLSIPISTSAVRQSQREEGTAYLQSCQVGIRLGVNNWLRFSRVFFPPNLKHMKITSVKMTWSDLLQHCSMEKELWVLVNNTLTMSQ